MPDEQKQHSMVGDFAKVSSALPFDRGMTYLALEALERIETQYRSLEEQLEAAQQALRAYRAIFVAWEGLGSITLNEEALRQWKSIADSVLSNSASEPS